MDRMQFCLQRARANLRVLIPAAFILASTDSGAYDIATSANLLGDWGGVRSHLADQGVAFQLSYVGEAAHNFSGGKEHLTRYADQWAFGSTLDLNKLWGWEGGTFQASVTDRDGRDLGADAGIGNDMLIQEIYGRGQTWHLTQFWLNQRLLDDRLQAKIGRLGVGEDFASFSCDFQNLAFCTAQPGNLVGNYWVNWPTSQWAARIKYEASPQAYLQIGAYQVNPHYVDNEYAHYNGWKLDFPNGTTGALIPLEAGWLPRFDDLPGTYKIGVWYNTSKGDDLYYDVNRNPRGETGLEALKRHGQYGAYLNFQQQVTGTAGGRGATVFLNISQADRNTAELDGQISTGVQYQGPFERLRDQIGFAIGATHNNPRFADFIRQNNTRTGANTIAGDGYEYVSEVYYSWSPVPSMSFRPNLQYILRPGGASQNENAFAVGLKSVITF
jgi:porin